MDIFIAIYNKSYQPLCFKHNMAGDINIPYLIVLALKFTWKNFIILHNYTEGIIEIRDRGLYFEFINN